MIKLDKTSNKWSIYLIKLFSFFLWYTRFLTYSQIKKIMIRCTSYFFFFSSNVHVQVACLRICIFGLFLALSIWWIFFSYIIQIQTFLSILSNSRIEIIRRKRRTFQWFYACWRKFMSWFFLFKSSQQSFLWYCSGRIVNLIHRLMMKAYKIFE
jgi:hypothetical protein